MCFLIYMLLQTNMFYKKIKSKVNQNMNVLHNKYPEEYSENVWMFSGLNKVVDRSFILLIIISAFWSPRQQRASADNKNEMWHRYNGKDQLFQLIKLTFISQGDKIKNQINEWKNRRRKWIKMSI